MVLRTEANHLTETPMQSDTAAIGQPSSAPPAPPESTLRIIAMINQKGGVGKTTSAVNLGAALSAMGQRVLLIDLDPQAHMTLHMGINPDEIELSVYHLLTYEDVTASQVAQRVNDHLTILPAEVNLAGVEAELAPKMITGQAQRILQKKCMPLIEEGFDYVIMDCPPSLGLLTICGLILAREVVVPMQAHFLALQGLSKLLETIGFIRQSFNPDLIVSGLILCMYEGHTILANEVLADLTSFLEQHRELDVPWRDAQILQPAVRRNIKLAECPSFGQTIFDYEPTCAGAKDYRALAASFAGQKISD